MTDIKDLAIELLMRDVLTLAMRLYGEHEDSFSDETYRVMEKWKPRVEQIISGDISFEDTIAKGTGK